MINVLYPVQGNFEELYIFVTCLVSILGGPDEIVGNDAKICENVAVCI